MQRFNLKRNELCLQINARRFRWMRRNVMNWYPKRYGGVTDLLPLEGERDWPG